MYGSLLTGASGIQKLLDSVHTGTALVQKTELKPVGNPDQHGLLGNQIHEDRYRQCSTQRLAQLRAHRLSHVLPRGTLSTWSNMVTQLHIMA